jgi:hypothetical protein
MLATGWGFMSRRISASSLALFGLDASSKLILMAAIGISSPRV